MWHFKKSRRIKWLPALRGRAAAISGAALAGFGHGRGHGDGGGHGRRRGLYDGDELRLVLLSLIAEKPRHGYDLIRRSRNAAAAFMRPAPA